MKGRRGFLLAVAALGVGGLLFVGCGAKESTEQVAFVSNILTDKTENNEAVRSGVDRYAKEHGVIANIVTPASKDLADIEKAIDGAVEEGARTVVCYGQEMVQAIYDMQRMERGVRFILIDGIPKDEKSGEKKIRDNTTCITPSEEQAGFLAGYAAVSEGFRDLAVYAGAKTAAGIRNVSGFLQGAEQAARDAGSNVDGVKVTVRYLGANTASPYLLTEAENRIASGCQFLYAFDSGPDYLVAQAASVAGGKAIISKRGEDIPMDAVLATADIDYGMAAFRALEKDKEGTLLAGDMVTLNAGDGGAALLRVGNGFRYFSEDNYANLVDRIGRGKVTILAEDVTDETVGYAFTKAEVVTEGR